MFELMNESGYNIVPKILSKTLGIVDAVILAELYLKQGQVDDKYVEVPARHFAELLGYSEEKMRVRIKKLKDNNLILQQIEKDTRFFIYKYRVNTAEVLKRIQAQQKVVASPTKSRDIPPKMLESTTNNKDNQLKTNKTTKTAETTPPVPSFRKSKKEKGEGRRGLAGLPAIKEEPRKETQAEIIARYIDKEHTHYIYRIEEWIKALRSVGKIMSGSQLKSFCQQISAAHLQMSDNDVCAEIEKATKNKWMKLVFRM